MPGRSDDVCCLGKTGSDQQAAKPTRSTQIGPCGPRLFRHLTPFKIPNCGPIMLQDAIPQRASRGGERMKRREFITFLGVAVVGWPRAARSQKQSVPRVGYI